jgi:hypothetical protein
MQFREPRSSVCMNDQIVRLIQGKTAADTQKCRDPQCPDSHAKPSTQVTALPSIARDWLKLRTTASPKLSRPTGRLPKLTVEFPYQ